MDLTFTKAIKQISGYSDMNGKLIVAGLAFIVIGVIMLLPSLFLEARGSPVTSTSDLAKIPVDALADTVDNEQARHTAEKTSEAFGILDSVPYILILLGLIIFVICLFAS